jgi:hypothetical protein
LDMPRYRQVLSFLRLAILCLLGLALLISVLRFVFSELYNALHFGYVHNKFGRKVYSDRDPIETILFARYFFIYCVGAIILARTARDAVLGLFRYYRLPTRKGAASRREIRPLPHAQVCRRGGFRRPVQFSASACDGVVAPRARHRVSAAARPYGAHSAAGVGSSCASVGPVPIAPANARNASFIP